MPTIVTKYADGKMIEEIGGIYRLKHLPFPQIGEVVRIVNNFGEYPRQEREAVVTAVNEEEGTYDVRIETPMAEPPGVLGDHFPGSGGPTGRSRLA